MLHDRVGIQVRVTTATLRPPEDEGRRQYQKKKKR